MADRVFLRGIRVFGRHGVFEEEARLGQEFIVDLDWWLDTATYGSKDDLAGGVSYQDVYEVVHALVEQRRFKLIEALAEALAAVLLDRFAAMERVRVIVHKPRAPISGIFDDVGVEIERIRGTRP